MGSSFAKNNKEIGNKSVSDDEKYDTIQTNKGSFGGRFSNVPLDVIKLVILYLDLKSLCFLSQACTGNLNKSNSR